jgi:tRNA uridine 5-carboxymethylaminomethyl modification enzyme
MLPLDDLLRATGWSGDSATVEWADIELKYEGYLRRETAAAARLISQENFLLPSDLPILSLQTISREAREKLAERRPATVAGAGRIPGVSPSDLQNLVMETLKWSARQRSPE